MVSGLFVGLELAYHSQNTGLEETSGSYPRWRRWAVNPVTVFRLHQNFGTRSQRRGWKRQDGKAKHQTSAGLFVAVKSFRRWTPVQGCLWRSCGWASLSALLLLRIDGLTTGSVRYFFISRKNKHKTSLFTFPSVAGWVRSAYPNELPCNPFQNISEGF